MYDMIKCAAGWIAGSITFGYSIVALVAISDGHGGVEIPLNVAIPSMTLIIVLTSMSVQMRLATRIERRVVDAVDHKVKAHHRHLRESIKAEVAAALEQVSGQSYRVGMVHQAQATAAASADMPDSDAIVTPMPRTYGRR